VHASDDASINIGVRVWSKTTDHLAVKWALSKAIREVIEKEKLGAPPPKCLFEFTSETAEELKKLPKKSA
jgi:small-conductance mechanosensitive channel